MAWDHYRRAQLGDNVKVEFWTGMPSMFAVKKYADALDALRKSRGIPAQFSHNLISIDAGNRVATFKKTTPSGATCLEVQVNKADKNYPYWSRSLCNHTSTCRESASASSFLVLRLTCSSARSGVSCQ